MEAKPAAVASTDADPQQPQRPRPRRKRFVLFGDSITQQSFAQGGWGARLADAYARRVREERVWFGGREKRREVEVEADDDDGKRK